MPTRNELRKEAYKFTLELLRKIPTVETEDGQEFELSLDELRLLKEGIEDPSQDLVSALKYLSKDIISKDEIDRYLVIPFLSNNTRKI
jgi:hypothetical protein